MKRRSLVTIVGASIGVGTVGAVSGAQQENYAEITFNDQKSNGDSVVVDHVLVEADGFITIHTWDLIAEQDGPNTIVGVSDLLTPGSYSAVEVSVFDDGTGYSEVFEQDRLENGRHRLVAVPHRDMEQTGSFDFTTEPHTDIPFTEGTQTRDDLPVEDAVNDIARVVVAPGHGESAGNGPP